LLENNSISSKDLEQKDELGIGKVNWKNYLKSLDASQKVAEFTNKMRRIILSKALANQNPVQDKNPKNTLVKPIAIFVLSLLALSTLIIIVRKRKQRRKI